MEKVAAYTLEDNGGLIMSPRKQKEIIFKNIELDEEAPPGTQELVDEMLSEWIFRLWIKEKSFQERPTEQKTPAQNHKMDVESNRPEISWDI